ncbi:glycerol-3-phosphate acyltransferase PlsY [Marininema mesophilum]|uniref:Glycerol-3-phosphate acyltransferase PlsY n=1 Tax=Marininema mesophilum TaxID=1048340 RepID=A0A1H2YZA1_9BACL|nr:glycerol-3-phosphate acyltransferase [Marininema mesophilum]SDX10493.1 glycerol-3-phosphate acyltransferase PlsY [Marininema mesophilum]
MTTYLLIIVTAYLVGSLPLVSLWKGKGFRAWPPHDGVYQPRNLSESMWILFLEVGKGAIATLLGLMFLGWSGAAFAALMVVTGHLFPIFTGFRGGKGMAVSAGSLLILSPFLFIIGIGIYVTVLLLTRYLSISAVVATGGVLLLSLVLFPSFYVIIVVFILGTLILFRYREPIARWRRGSERPFHFRGFRRWG